jgi:hypothetical protein
MAAGRAGKPKLGQRLFESGNPNPEFALLGTVNWMRALAMLTSSSRFESDLTALLKGVNWRRETRQELQDVAMEKLFLAASYLAALRAMTGVPNAHDVARVCIVSWYYCIYFSAQAMLAIAGQSVPEEHLKTARVWLNQLVTGQAIPTVPYPFDLSVSSLVKQVADNECDVLKRGTGQDVNRVPRTQDQAHDADVSYLKGSAGFYREKEEQRVRISRDFQDAGYQDLRKKAARELRDASLSKKRVGFLDMAFR